MVISIHFSPLVPEAFRSELTKAASRFYYGGGPPYADLVEAPSLRLEPVGQTIAEPQGRRTHRFYFDVAGLSVWIKPA